MGSEKVTMVLDADLKCSKCFKKIKKILCKIPEIHDQAYDEKTGKVTIKVATSNPEKIKQKILCKGCSCIKSIEIKVPDKKPPAPAPPAPALKQSIAIGVCCPQPFGGYPCFPGCGGQCGGQCDGNCGRKCGGQCDDNCGRRCGGQCDGSSCGRRCGGQCEESCSGRRCGGRCDGRCRKQCCGNQCNACEENPKGGCTPM